MLLIGVVLCSTLVFQVACGGGSTSGTEADGEYDYGYGSSGATQHSTTVNLTVQ